ncbi:MAG: diphthine synthase [Methanophagales archaeon]|nr:diphthine synthase [Methanophagales archaeon]MCW3141279.1 diphthine synthase [Methanophagales archaeon]
MLTFIGLGLYDEKDITLKGLEAIRDADVVYAEFYTSPLGGKTVEKMEEVYGKRVSILERGDIEEKAEEWFLKLAKSKKVVLLSGGDAMIATTHVDLRLRAIDMGIETRIIHAPSISSAVAGLCGFQSYKFGKSATVAPPYKGGISEVPYDTIIANKERGLHTLLYLDISMHINEALKLLEMVEGKRKGEVLKKSVIVGIARAGSDKPVVKADYLDALKSYEFGELPHVLVVPGELHFMEKEALVKIAQAPEAI